MGRMVIPSKSSSTSSNQYGVHCIWPLPEKGMDIGLLATVAALVVFGLLMVYSASFIFAQERMGDGFGLIKKQMIHALLGFAALVAGCRISYRKWADWSMIGLLAATILLALVMMPGVGAKVGGAQRWIRLGFLNIQPGELAKFAVISFVAWQLARKHERLDKLAAGVFSNFLLPLPALLLLLAQPDFGTTVMITLVILCLMFLGGVPLRFLASVMLTASLAATVLIFSSAYRKARFLGFMDPWSDPMGKGFQIIQSMLGLHNGSVFGVGLGNGKEKLFYLPEAHNDFIFAVIGEELGFLGLVGVVLAFSYFIYRGLRISWESYHKYGDRYGMLLAAGITLALGIQGFVNMAVVLGLVPTKGLTLPFISYGGSALIVDLFAVGVLLSIARGPQANGKKEQLASTA